jgi:hypothetical protein
MSKYLFEISGVLCEGRFEDPDAAIVGGHGRLGADDGSTVRVGELADGAIRWLGQWVYRKAAMWRPE